MSFPSSPNDGDLYTNALGTVYQYDSTRTAWIILSHIKPEGQIFLSAAGMWPSTTSGCSSNIKTETSTNKINYYYLNFNDSTRQNAEVTFAMPSDYNGGTITAKFYWEHTSDTTNADVVWGCQGRAYDNDDTIDQSFGTAQTVTDTGGTAGKIYISSETPAITLAGSPNAGQLVQARVFRDATDAADTLAQNARMLGVMINFTRSL